MRFYEIHAKTALNRVPEASRMPFRWTINPYRGCTHACVYCLDGDTPILMARRAAQGAARRPGRRRDLRHRAARRRAAALRQDARARALDDDQAGGARDARGRHRAAGQRRPPVPHRPRVEARRARVGPRRGRTSRRAVSLLGPGRFAAPPARDRRLPARLPVRDDPRRRPGARGARAGGVLPRALRRRGRRRRAARMASFARAERVEALIAWPFEPGDAWRKGFLAGIFDADGVLDGEELRIANADATILSWTELPGLVRVRAGRSAAPDDGRRARRARARRDARAAAVLPPRLTRRSTAKWDFDGRPLKTRRAAAGGGDRAGERRPSRVV